MDSKLMGNIIFGMAIVASMAAAVFLLGNGRGTGLLALQTPQGDEGGLVPGSMEASISPQLSFEALCTAKLEMGKVETAVGKCPAYSQLVFEVENADGGCRAERVFFRHSENIRVLSCINCNADVIEPGKKIRIEAKACRLAEGPAEAAFSSVNAKEVAVAIS